MAAKSPLEIVVVGAGAAGLMAALELARAGMRVTILEARGRLGGRIDPLAASEFGYRAEGGAEFVHGEAPVTRAVAKAAGVTLVSRGGAAWSTRQGALAPATWDTPYQDELHAALAALTTDMPIAQFLAQHFGDPKYAEMVRSMTRTVEGYDAADPARISTFALREEWMDEGIGRQARPRDSYGAMIDYLAAECRKHGAAIHLKAPVAAIEMTDGVSVRSTNGTAHRGDIVVVTAPLPTLDAIALPGAVRERIAKPAAEIGIGNVIKILLRFRTQFWAKIDGRDLSDLFFLFSNELVPTWWTQFPDTHPVLTGWLAGPKTAKYTAMNEDEIAEIGLGALASIFGAKKEALAAELTAKRVIDWGKDPFARGAYSYATPETRTAQAQLREPFDGKLFLAGEALYSGPDMGTVEAALANGQDTARMILGRNSN